MKQILSSGLILQTMVYFESESTKHNRKKEVALSGFFSEQDKTEVEIKEVGLLLCLMFNLFTAVLWYDPLSTKA